MTGLIVGRFQPFHNGHLELVKTALKDCDELIIAICSAEQSHTKQNPWTAGERYEMIHRCLRNETIGVFRLTSVRYIHIIPVRDINRPNLWVRHMESMLPEFDVVYTGNNFVKLLFEESGYDVKFVKQRTISGTEIREALLTDGEYSDNYLINRELDKLKEGLPKSIKDYITEEHMMRLWCNLKE